MTKQTVKDVHNGDKGYQCLLSVDRGWAWVILAASFFSNLLAIGYFRSFGVLFAEFLKMYSAPTSVTSLIMGLLGASMSISGFLTQSILMSKFYERTIMSTGGLLIGGGVITSTVATSIPVLIVTQSLMVGTGIGMLSGPMVVILNKYFDRRNALALAVSSTGANVGAIILPPFVRYLLDEFGLQGTFMITGAVLLHIMAFGFLYRPFNYTQFKVDICKPLLDTSLHENVANTEFTVEPERDKALRNGEPSVYTEDNVKRERSKILLNNNGREHFANIICTVKQEHSTRLNDGEQVHVTDTDSTVKTERTKYLLNQSEHEHREDTSKIEHRKYRLHDGEHVDDREETSKIELPNDGEQEQVDDGEDTSKKEFTQPLLNDTEQEHVVDDEEANFKRETQPLLIDDEQEIVADTETNFKKERAQSFLNEGEIENGADMDDILKTTSGGQNEHIDDGEGNLKKKRTNPLLIDDERETAADIEVKLKTTNDDHNKYVSVTEQNLDTSKDNIQMFRFRNPSNSDSLGVEVNANSEIPSGVQDKNEPVCDDCPVLKKQISNDCMRVFSFALFKNPRFIIMVAFSVFGIHAATTMNTYIPVLAESKNISETKSALLLSIVGATGIVSRLFIGFVADLKVMKRSYMLSLTIGISGVAALCAPLYFDFNSMIIYCVIYGLCGGLYFNLIPIVLVDFLGIERLKMSYGFIQLFGGMSMTAVNPLAGWIHDQSGNWDLAYQLFGGLSLLAAIVLLFEIFVAKCDH